MTYLGTQTAAKRLLTNKGQAITITPPTTGTYSTATGTVSGSAPTPVSTIGVVLPLSRGLRHATGSDIQVGDQQLLLPGDIAQPSIDSKVTIGGATFTLIEIMPTNPAGTPVLYDCVIRQ